MPPPQLARYLYLRYLSRLARIERYRAMLAMLWRRRLVSRLWFVRSPLELYLVTRSPYWIHALYRSCRLAAYALSFVRGLIRKLGVARVGRISRIVMAKVLWRLAKRYVSVMDSLIDFYRDVIGFWAVINKAVWEAIRKEHELFIRPVAYIEYLPKTLQPAMIYVIQDSSELAVSMYPEEVARALLELAMGKANLEEVVRRYPEIRSFLESMGIHVEEVMSGRKFFAVVPVLEPIASEVTKGMRIWFYAYVCDAHSPLSDPELAASFAHDIHRAEARWKWSHERITEIGIPVPEEYLAFPSGLTEEEFYELDAMDFLVESPLLKTLIASSWGKPEEWWRIDLAEPAWSTGELISRAARSVLYRRRPGGRLIRTLIEFMGVR